MSFRKLTLNALVSCAALALATLSPSTAVAEETNDFVVTLLGTGSPAPDIERFGSSTLVQVAGQTLVFDAGRGAMIRIRQAGVIPTVIDHVFISHFHSDHTVGLPDLWLTSWIPNFGGRSEPFAISGPIGTKRLTEGLTIAYADDHRIRIEDAGLDPVGVEWSVNEFDHGGVVYEQDGVTVTSFEVHHGDKVTPAFGYRIDYDGRSVVIAGDTTPNDNVIKYATGVDLLVHPVAMASKLIARLPGIKVILAHHTKPDQAAEVFSAARPKLAAFTHLSLMGPGRSRPTPEDVVALTAEGYDGDIVAGKDLMSFIIGDTVEIVEPE